MWNSWQKFNMYSWKKTKHYPPLRAMRSPSTDRLTWQPGPSFYSSNYIMPQITYEELQFRSDLIGKDSPVTLLSNEVTLFWMVSQHLHRLWPPLQLPMCNVSLAVTLLCLSLVISLGARKFFNGFSPTIYDCRFLGKSHCVG